MNRRAFVAMIGGSVLAGSRAGEAQQAGKVWRIGFLSPYSADFDKTWRAGFKLGLLDLGYVEGKNLVIDERHAKGRADRFPELAAELVRMKIDIFVVHGFPQAVRAAEQASTACVCGRRLSPGAACTSRRVQIDRTRCRGMLMSSSRAHLPPHT